MEIKGNPDAKPYSVVFRNTAEAGNYEGVITWTNFADKASFDVKCPGGKMMGFGEVIAQGVTSEEAVALSMSTSPKARLLVALEEATDSDGKVNMQRLQHMLAMALIAIAQSPHVQR